MLEKIYVKVLRQVKTLNVTKKQRNFCRKLYKMEKEKILGNT